MKVQNKFITISQSFTGIAAAIEASGKAWAWSQNKNCEPQLPSIPTIVKNLRNRKV
jgi:hypothetical protein